jgi:AAA15 family ATPase/GTPase
MYIDHLGLGNIRTFQEAELELIHPHRIYRKDDPASPVAKRTLPKPRLNNVNLLLGENGSGKSTVLRAIALLSLGPAVRQFALSSNDMVRRGEGDAAIHSTLLFSSFQDFLY